jgi:two-component system, OmpR family, sensor kinase
MRRGLSLFQQALFLSLATLVAAEIVALAAALWIAPPKFESYAVEDVVAGLRGEPPLHHYDHALRRYAASAPPGRPLNNWGARRVAENVASELQLSPQQVEVTAPRPSAEWLNLLFAERPPPRTHFLRPAHSPGQPPVPTLMGRFSVSIMRPDGRWWVVEPVRSLGLDPWQLHVLTIFALAAIAATPLAWVFSRRLASPIAALGEAARRMGETLETPPVTVSGSTEVAAAAQAFNEMAARLKRSVSERTSMIGAIAHDLRTPLTRLRFRVDAAPDHLREKMNADIDQMEAMISSVLAFVNSEVGSPEFKPTDLASLVEAVVDEAAETGANAIWESSPWLVVNGDAMALRRLVANLIDNGLKYGHRVRARVYRVGGDAIAEIDDDGPGIPAEETERMFQPFVRRETSRNRETGGVGMGLAIARALARRHGGTLDLVNRPGGGLRARLTLPAAAV